GQGSLIGPLANLIAVPWVSFVVVPVTVAASLLLATMPSIGEPLLQLASWLLQGLWWLMERLAALPFAQRYFAEAPLWTLLLALLGIGWCLLPRGMPARGFGLILLLPLLLPARSVLKEGEFEVWTFDVGQGLAVALRTRDHVLLYDAGPRYPSGFDLGDAVVVPSLLALDIRLLDRLVLSHADNDHAGGASAVQLALPTQHVESGEPQRLQVLQPALRPQRCNAGDTWQWNGVQVRTLAPDAETEERGNDSSCVILVESAYGSLLLTGDAGSRVEAALAAGLGSAQRPRVLSVPHHGSKSSSSAALLDAFAPDLAVMSSGYRNRFGHPHPSVSERYAERGIAVLNTAEHGYVYVRFTAEAQAPRQGREVRRAWWRPR
ncbi:MAG: DNA internalization-related competence protein ComEC/Rec2, partial [Dokdonella sp.]